jgi:hypothetical protein
VLCLLSLQAQQVSQLWNKLMEVSGWVTGAALPADLSE